jgi:8-oxo-dGTP pyrophosphatase MutT (NUDIX family)
MQRHVIIPAVCLLLECDGKWFVGRRQNTGYCDGCLNMPAGHIDPNEIPREAAVREAKEEVGIEVSAEEIEFVHIQYNRNIDSTHDRTHYYFKIHCCDQEPINTEPHKCSEVLWIRIGEKLDEFVPFMQEALKAMLQGKQYSEFYEGQRL